MTHTYILYNPEAGRGKARRSAWKLYRKLRDEPTSLLDLTHIEDLPSFFAGLEPEDRFILCGGDGTLHRFINAVDTVSMPEHLYYCPCGDGCDFWYDLDRASEDRLVDLSRYLKALPRVVVDGTTRLFLNSVGGGIDGYCCEENHRLLKSGGRAGNYKPIARRGVLGRFHPCGAVVTVDGVKRRYEKVWLAPVLNGRYSGGMLCAPEQDRLIADHTVSLLVIHDAGRLKMLSVISAIKKGKHTKYTDAVDVFSGHELLVQFDRPCPLQIDGETIRDVTEYRVSA